MSSERSVPFRVFHGTFNEVAPQHLRTGMRNSFFFAGTLQAAKDRGAGYREAYPDNPDYQNRPYTIHGYDVMVPPSSTIYDDDDSDSLVNDEPYNPVQGSETEIRAYINAQEDPRSLSYTIPTSFVDGRRVKHLGPQFVFEPNQPIE